MEYYLVQYFPSRNSSVLCLVVFILMSNSVSPYTGPDVNSSDDSQGYRNSYFDVEEPVAGSYVRRKFDSSTTVQFCQGGRPGNPPTTTTFKGRTEGEFELKFIGGKPTNFSWRI